MSDAMTSQHVIVTWRRHVICLLSLHRDDELGMPDADFTTCTTWWRRRNYVARCLWWQCGSSCFIGAWFTLHATCFISSFFCVHENSACDV